MNKRISIFSLAFLFCFLLICKEGYAQKADDSFTPYSGQGGKDVVWVPTPQELVDAMLDMANVTSADYVIDLGSGDGRLVITAAKRGAKALGIEYNPQMVEVAKRAAIEEKVTALAEFKNADLFESDFSEATVLTLFLLSSINLKLRPIILDMKPGTRVVSNTFDMNNWKPDQTYKITDSDSNWDTALLWIVPAKVDGTWKLNNGTIKFVQEFQNITGTKTVGNNEMVITGQLNGDKISFDAGGMEYKGTVTGNTISGTDADGKVWKAIRE